MRYIYHNIAYERSGAAHGMMCDPVRNHLGRCVVGNGKAIVVFDDGTVAVVIRRCLRLTEKYKKKEQ